MKVVKWLDKNLEKTMCCVLLLIMVFCITAQLILRWAGQDLAWTEEIARYCFVWLIWVSCAEGVKLRKHIKVDALLLVFKDGGKFVLRVISNVLFFVFCIIMAYFEVQLCYKIGFVQHQVSPAVQLPMIIPYASVGVGMFLMAFRLIQDTVKVFRERKAEIAVGNEKRREVGA